MFCRKCGKPLSDHMKFCPKCGASVVMDAPVAPAGAQATTASVTQAAAPTEQGATQATAAPTAPVAEAVAMPTAPAAPAPAGQATQILQTAQPTSPVAPLPQVAQAPTPAPAEKKKGGMKWVFIGIAVVLLIAAIVFVLFFLRGKNEKDTVTDGTVEETEVSRSKKGEVSFDFHSITTSDSLENVTILVMSGHSNIDGEPLETLTTDGDGRASVELESGEYTLVWKRDGYYNGCRDLDVEWKDDTSNPDEWRDYTKISAATVGNFLTQLFGGTYDLTTFTHDADAFVDLYYDDGQLICSAGWIELDEWAWYERTEADPIYDQYKDVVFSVGGDEYVAGSVALSLRMVNNDLGYMITSYTCSKYSR